MIEGSVSHPFRAIEASNGSPNANQGFSKAEPRHSHAVCTTSLPPFLLMLILSPLLGVTSQDEIFMPSAASFISESVYFNPTLRKETENLELPLSIIQSLMLISNKEMK